MHRGLQERPIEVNQVDDQPILGDWNRALDLAKVHLCQVLNILEEEIPQGFMASCTGEIAWQLSTRIKDAGIAIRHSRERILFYTAGSRNEFGRCVHTQFGSQITKIEVSTFWMSGIPKFSRRRPMPAFSLVSFKQSRPSPCNIWPR